MNNMILLPFITIIIGIGLPVFIFYLIEKLLKIIDKKKSLTKLIKS